MSRKTSTLELKVPIAKINVFEISFQYLFKTVSPDYLIVIIGKQMIL